MKTVIADTNVYLRFILNDVKSQADEAERLFKKANSGKIHIAVPQIVIFEIQFALDKYYKFAKEEVIKKIELILSAGFLDVQDRNVFLECIRIYEDRSISFVDSFLKAKAKHENAELFSFDKRVLKAKI